ncbi:proteasome assembly chaperone 2 [[Candida] anglica]|uniref:Proteasome assembly chaperone 2 n=1 Tax=[Candida] anglica TaxID=148631 RepID=A0ABP0EBT1_9ASCO
MAHFNTGWSLEKLKDSTLIIPAISLGNIPQLTVDLLLHTRDFVSVGVLDDIYLHPFSSPVDVSPTKSANGISNAAEIYYSTKNNITVIQQRSPIIGSFTKQFVSEVILKLISDVSFNKVIILDSADAGLLEQSDAKTIELYTNEDLLNKSLETLKISQKTQLPLTSPYQYSKYVLELINALNSSASTVDIQALVSHVYEGDNFNDAELLANELSQTLDVSSTMNWIRPVSWLGVYGDKPVPNSMEDGLFG